MEFRVLGSLEVFVEGRALVLAGRKQRALLAMLLLEANRVVSIDRLTEALWQGAPPETAAKAVQVYVSQLRRALGRERLQTRPPGYLLWVEGGELDLERFQELMAEARYADALALWRGPPLADCLVSGFAEAESARLAELRLACLEKRIDRDLADGCHAELVGELEALVCEFPFREGLRAQLMLALYRCGRQAEALAAYQAARRTLVEELGVEPARPLRELEQAILRQDPALELEQLPAAERPASLVVRERLQSAQEGREGRVGELTERAVRRTVSAIVIELLAASLGGAVLDPEASKRVADRALAEIERAVVRHGGRIETVGSDAVTAVFGLPAAHEDDAVRAVRAAVEARDALAALASELAERRLLLEFRLGAGTGRVVSGGEAATLGAVAAPLTVAARLARTAAPGELIVDGATRHLLRDAAVVEASTTVSFRILEVAVQPTARVIRVGSPMVGRKQERRRLHAAFEETIGAASCLLVTVLGAAGVGKSRLVQEFLDDLAGRALVARGRCLPYGEGITYWPLLEAVKEAAPLGEAETREESVRKLAAVLEGEPDAGQIAVRVAGLIGLADAHGRADQAFAAVCGFFQALARGRPLVLVFEDIQWAETTFLDLVEYVAEVTRGAPILLICLARPELLESRPGWGGGKLHASSTLLEPLSEAESSQLVDNLVGAAPVDRAARRQIVEAAEGNPLFVEEMLALLQTREHGADERLELPPTIEALLAARLDQLTGEERALLEAGAVEGKIFHQASAERLLGTPAGSSVSEQLIALVRKDLIRPERPLFPGEHAFQFRHLLIRDAAYESTPKAARAAMHAAHARWLEQAASARSGEYAEIIGYHLEQAAHYRLELDPRDRSGADLAQQAAAHLGTAGRRAFLRSDAPAAINLISRAATLLPADDPARVDLIPNLRLVQGMRGDLSWATAILDQTLTAGDERLQAHALIQRSFLRLFSEREIVPAELIKVGELAARVFDQTADELGLARAGRLIAQAHYLARRADACVEASEQALIHARRADDPLEQREIIEWLAVALTLGPTPASKALRRCEQLTDEAAGDPDLTVALLSMRAYLEAIQGRATTAQRLLDQARATADDPSHLYQIAHFPAYAGLILLNDPAAAERELRAGYQALAQVGEQTNSCAVAALLAHTLCEQHRYAEATRFTRLSEQAARANDVYANVSWRTVRARVLTRQGQVAAAEALAREAVAFAQESDFLAAHADALTQLAEILTLKGQSRQAARALEQAIHLYEQKEHLVAVANIHALLETSTERRSRRPRRPTRPATQ